MMVVVVDTTTCHYSLIVCSSGGKVDVVDTHALQDDRGNDGLMVHVKLRKILRPDHGSLDDTGEQLNMSQYAG